MRVLYKFASNRIFKEESRTENEDGTFTVKMEDKKIPIDAYMKKLTSRDEDDMVLFYNISYSQLQTKGVATKLMIANSYFNAGGVETEKEFGEWQDVFLKTNEKRNEILLKRGKGEDVEKLEDEYRDLVVSLRNREDFHNSIFERSAEEMANKEIVLWLVLNFTFLKNGEEYVSPWKGVTYEAKKDFYYDICDDESDKFQFEKDLFSKAYGLWLHWFKGATKEEHFKEYEGLIDEQLFESDSGPNI